MPPEIEVWLLRVAAGALLAFVGWFLRDSWRRLREVEEKTEAHDIRLERAEMRLNWLEES